MKKISIILAVLSLVMVLAIMVASFAGCGTGKEVKRPEYIGKYLEEIMKSKIDMKGFNSLKELYSSSKDKSYTSAPGES